MPNSVDVGGVTPSSTPDAGGGGVDLATPRSSSPTLEEMKKEGMLSKKGRIMKQVRQVAATTATQRHRGELNKRYCGATRAKRPDRAEDLDTRAI